MDKGAVISSCENYRYQLWRYWEPSKPLAMFIMLNPSTADANEDDPTIRRCINFAKSWGYGGLVVCNLFALRSTDPKRLRNHAAPIGWMNDTYLKATAGNVNRIICAWGNDGAYCNRSKHVIDLLKDYDLYAIKINQGSGEPAHPLYLKANLTPILMKQKC